ncbi:hypothetical protein RB595_008250 [Gaeumannomyces hyphopodioides]
MAFFSSPFPAHPRVPSTHFPLAPGDQPPLWNLSPATMKFTSIATTAAVLAAGADACIRITTYQVNSGFGWGRMSIQLWDNNDFYCEAHQDKGFPSANTVWDIKCPNGDYWVHVWDNGGTGWVERVGVWSANLRRRDAKSEKGDNGGWDYSYAHDDNFGNCHEYSVPPI